MLTFSQIIEFSDSQEHICKLNPLFKVIIFLMLQNHFLVINKSFSHFVKTNKLTNLTIWIDISVYQGGLPCLTTLDIGGADGLTETGLRRILEHTGPAFNKLYYQFEGIPNFSASFIQDIQQQYPNVTIFSEKDKTQKVISPYT